LEYSNNLDYKNAKTQDEADLAYDAVNISRKLFLFSLGTVGITYVYDFTWSLVKGFGNIKKSAYYRKKLRQAPIDVKLSNF